MTINLLNKKIFSSVWLALFLGLIFAFPARADYVGQLETTKYFDAATRALILSRLSSGQNLQIGDEISYIIQFTPTDNGGNIGGGGFVTDYIPAGTVVTDAQFIRLNTDGTYTEISPPGPAAVRPTQVPLYSDTGIFFSTDARTAVSPANTVITAANGTALPSKTGCSGISLPSSTHNAWDAAMVAKYVGGNRDSTNTNCAAPPAVNYVTTGGVSPVAGPDTFIQQDATGSVGPWQRISYMGSMKGTAAGVAGGVGGCVGGTPTLAGYNLSPDNPLPSNTNAVRFAAGKVTVGELFSVRITLRLTATMPASGIINNSEVFGGDASMDVGGGAAKAPGEFNHWRYHCPAVAASNSNLMLVKQLVGACSGATCTPTTIAAGVVPAIANLKLRYEIFYLNTGGATQTNVVLTDALAAGVAYVTGSYVQLSGTTIGAPAVAGTPKVMTFPKIATLASGASGKIQYDVLVATKPTDGTAIDNTATLKSTSIPNGVTSTAIATVSTQANLWIGKSTSTPTRFAGELVSYTITIPNNGGTAVMATTSIPINVYDYLPTSGLSTAASDRFSYVAGSVVATSTTAAGAATALAPTVVVTNPATATAREKVQFQFKTGSIPVGGKLVVTFNATVGGNVPSSAAAYLNNADVWYAGGPGGTTLNSSMSETIGSAPVKILAPMSLAVKVDCVYAGATCVPYANGSIAPNSKIRYRLDYKNISATPLTGVSLVDTLPVGTSFVTGTALRDGMSLVPTVTGQDMTFTSTTLNPGIVGVVTFDVQLGSGIVDGMDIVNAAKIKASTFLSGLVASVTSSVRHQAELAVTKTVSPGSVAAGGRVTYVVTVANVGSVPASDIIVHDELPFAAGTTAAERFSFVLGTSVFSTDDTAATKLVAVTPTVFNPPKFTGYTGDTNREELTWTFAAAKQLAPGKSITLTYDAIVGAAIPSSATAYYSDVQAEYISATTPPSSVMYDAAVKAAPVMIGGLDHIRIEHSGVGLTCAPETVTVKACADAACSTLSSGSVTTTVNGVSKTFLAGTTTLEVTQTTAGVLTLTATGTTPSAKNAARCFVGTTESCAMTFSDAGFILTEAADGAEVTVPVQKAGVASAQYLLRAVKKNSTTGACTAGLTGVQTINFGYECNDPSTCATGNLFRVNGTAVQANNNGGNWLGNTSYTGIDLIFDGNGNSTSSISFSYEDVGQITLRIQKSLNGANLLGNSNAFKVLPHHFAVDVCAAGSGDCAAGTAASATDGFGTVLAVAGTDSATQIGTGFSATVRAMSANGNVTPSFSTAGSANSGASHQSEQVTLSHTCVAPLVAGLCPSSGVLSGSLSFMRSDFVSGIKTVNDLTWSEAGVLKISADSSQFMGEVSGTTGMSANAGRFKAHHFNTIVAGPIACATGLACASGGMVYSGQVLQAVTVQAMNGNNEQLSNYQGGFAKKIDLSAVDSTGGVAVAAGVGAMGGTTSIAAGGSNARTLNGALVSNTGAPKFTFATKPTMPSDVFIRAVDTDGVSSERGVASVEGGVTVVSGQVKFYNTYGSELLPLTMMAEVRYFSAANGWIRSVTDSVTNLALSANYDVKDKASLKTGSTGVASAGVVTGGKMDITLNPPASRKAGVATITLPAVHPYLEAAISGQATFGIYQGKNQIIYLRESY
ncbi:MAG: hypothetical protein PHP57_03715 [Sideroxydans sp.]|nr:hypothetical protein [Sideroxydans sp.]